jgi:hypothetical protein
MHEDQDCQGGGGQIQTWPEYRKENVPIPPCNASGQGNEKNQRDTQCRRKDGTRAHQI